MACTRAALLAMLALVCVSSAAAQATDKRVPFPQPPWVIAHRGNAGELPEHTAQAYLQGIQEGADFIECDMTLTKDCQVVCRHEPDLNGTTDAYVKFPQYYGAYFIDDGGPQGSGGTKGVGILTTQMTLAEIKTLQAQARIETRAFRNTNYDLAGFKVITLQEYIDIAKAAADRVVGIIPEVKHPTYFNRILQTNSSACANNRTFSQICLEILQKNGYRGPFGTAQWYAQPAIIQSFEIDNLKELHNKTDIALVQLIDSPGNILGDHPNMTYAEMVTDAGLDAIARYAQLIAPYKSYYAPNNASLGNGTVPAPGYIRPGVGGKSDRVDVLAAGLKRNMPASPWTYRMENQFLAWDYQQDGWLEYEYVYNDLGLVGGVFTDFPKSLSSFLKCSASAKAAGLPGPGIIPPRPANPVFPQVTFKNRTTAQSFIGYPTDRLPTDRPWIIADGGASGVLPDSTVAAFQYAVDQGANFIACNVTATLDGQLICSHDINLGPTTDAALKFPNLAQNSSVNNATVSMVSVGDLTLAQVSTLRAKQLYAPNNVAYRDPNYNGLFPVATFSNFLAVAKNASHPVGVYVNILSPSAQSAALANQNTTVEDLVLAALTSAGYKGGLCNGAWNRTPVMIASVEATSLKALKNKTDIPLVQVITQVHTDTGLTWRQMTTAAGLDDIASYARAISPNKEFLVPALTTLDKNLRPSTGLTGEAQARGLLVFPYSFKNENSFLAWTWGQDPHRELDYLFNTEGVDGGLTDFPGTMNAYLQCQLREATHAFALAGPTSKTHALCFPATLSLAAAPAPAAATAATSGTVATAGRKLMSLSARSVQDHHQLPAEIPAHSQPADRKRHLQIQTETGPVGRTLNFATTLHTTLLRIAFPVLP